MTTDPAPRRRMVVRTRRPPAAAPGRGLVVGYAAAVAALAASEVLTTGPWRALQVAALVAAGALLVALRRCAATHGDRPARWREDVFPLAYRVLGMLATLLGAVLVLAAGRLPAEAVPALGWIAMGAALGLPDAVAVLAPRWASPPGPRS
jgi:hypothetical protein